MAESFANYQPGSNSFLDNVIEKSTGKDYNDAERLELGYNLAAAAGMGAQVASVSEMFRNSVRQQIAGRAYFAPFARGGMRNPTRNYQQSSVRNIVRGRITEAGFRYGVLFSEHFTNQELNFSWRTRY